MSERAHDSHKAKPRGSGVEQLLENNRSWAESVNKIDPEYFSELSKQQTPQYLWIGCSDSRVPANQVLGLAPGEVFVHRNIANVVSRVDLNCLSVVQFAVEVLKVEHIIVCGHYGCGGVKAANTNMRLGLVDNWIMNVVDIKNRYASLLDKIPEEHKDDALCELNVICQVRNVMESTVMQDWWKGYRRGNRQNLDWDQNQIEEALSETVEPEAPAKPVTGSTTVHDHHDVEIHGWIYGLKDGLVVPLIKLTAGDDPQLKLKKALTDIVRRYAPDALKKDPTHHLKK
eukprot:TRINITY_DN19972_c0_g1_i1.p1 TRINITY_DN19972_c0_g1~~TRINITY_DN19972_c0_g1_i1.p1  ORF type:complete len:286 (+),score=63.14 TRINITY_DN19972_c0_g1_i1:648-1505(+)